LILRPTSDNAQFMRPVIVNRVPTPAVDQVTNSPYWSRSYSLLTSIKSNQRKHCSCTPRETTTTLHVMRTSASEVRMWKNDLLRCQSPNIFYYCCCCSSCWTM